MTRAGVGAIHYIPDTRRQPRCAHFLPPGYCVIPTCRHYDGGERLTAADDDCDERSSVRHSAPGAHNGNRARVFERIGVDWAHYPFAATYAERKREHQHLKALLDLGRIERRGTRYAFEYRRAP